MYDKTQKNTSTKTQNLKKMTNKFLKFTIQQYKKIHQGNKIPISKRIKIRVQN